MSKHLSDERLSAYFDGEVTPEERAEIERLLDGSEEVKQELAEYRLLSKLLKELPRETVSQDLSVTVVQAVGRPEPRRGWKIVCSLAALSAGLILMLKMTESGRPQREMADISGERQHFMGEGEDASLLSEMKSAEMKPGRGFADATQAKRFSVDDEGGVIPQASKIPDSARNYGKAMSEEPEKGLVFDDLQKLRDADIGNMVTALEETTDGVNVVRLTVIDRQAGLSSLQVLLSRQKIPEEQAEGDSNVLRKKIRGEPAEQLVAVYVVATSPQLEAALRELRNSEQFQQLEMSELIDAGQLAQISGGPMKTFSGASAETFKFGKNVTSEKAKQGMSRMVGNDPTRQVELSLSPDMVRNSPPSKMDGREGLATRSLKEQQADPVHVLFVIVVQNSVHSKTTPQSVPLKGIRKRG